MLVLALIGASVAGEQKVIAIPAVKASLTIGNQPVTIGVSGTLSRLAKTGDAERFRLRMVTDLSDVQAHLTPLLRATVNRAERCGDHIDIQNAV
ncbi:MAG: hypothetical protein NTY38_07850, partial [Acidobacteria bacterium]|nr:hypothetical protein [Acidobacteriota bacterium]